MPSIPPNETAWKDSPRWQQATLWFLVLTTLIRLAQLNTMELVPDEAYYWDWSRRLSLGYYDQGPMIAYVIRLTTALCGTNEFGVRVGVCLASLGTLVCCYALARRIFSPFAGFLTALLLGATPLMEVGSVIATYDPLLVVFWAWTLLWLERAFFAPTLLEQRRAWIWVGFASGLGFVSKHTMALIVLCLGVFWLGSPAHRVWLRRREPYLALGIALALYSGVIWWNAHNHWWTFGHLLFLTGKVFGTPLQRFGEFIGSQALLLGPVLFLAIFASIRWGARRAETPTEPSAALERDRRRYLVCMGLPVFGFFCLLAFKAKVQGNWAPCAWLSLSVLCAGWLAERFAPQPKAMLAWTGAIVATSLFFTAGVLSPELRQSLGVRLKPDDDLSNTGYGWREMAREVQRVREEMERETGKKPIITANGYQYTALLAFYLPDRPETYDMTLRFRLTMYSAYVERLKAHLGGNALYVNNNQVEDPELRELFERIEWNAPYPIWRKPYYAEPIRSIYIARCYGYRKYQGLQWAIGG